MPRWCSSWVAKGCASRDARSRSTGRSCASRPRTSAGRDSAEGRRPTAPGGTHDMTILFTGRKAHLTPTLKSFAESKLGKLEKLLGDRIDAHVILKSEKHRQQAEVIIKARSRTLTAKAEAGEFTDAVSTCADRLLAQARRHADRMNSRRKGRGARSLDWRRVPGATAPAAVAPTDGLPEVVRMGRTEVRPMSVREALLRAMDADRPVLVFRDLASQQVAVLFLRADGQYGLVETET